VKSLATLLRIISAGLALCGLAILAGFVHHVDPDTGAHYDSGGRPMVQDAGGWQQPAASYISAYPRSLLFFIPSIALAALANKFSPPTKPPTGSRTD